MRALQCRGLACDEQVRSRSQHGDAGRHVRTREAMGACGYTRAGKSRIVDQDGIDAGICISFVHPSQLLPCIAKRVNAHYNQSQTFPQATTGFLTCSASTVSGNFWAQSLFTVYLFELGVLPPMSTTSPFCHTSGSPYQCNVPRQLCRINDAYSQGISPPCRRS
jgi:hypothetical protein